MNELQIFENAEFGQVRTLEEDGKILFCGSDVAKALGYSNAPDALSRHCRYIAKRYIPHPQSPEKTLEMSFVPEGDLYRLIIHSKLPSAEKFETWVFDEILPTIRKQGYYSAVLEVNPQDSLSLKDRLSFAQCIAKSPKWAEPLIRSLLEPYLPKLVAEPEPVYKPKKILEYLTSDDEDYYANDPKNLEIKARLGENTARSLDKCARELRVSKSAIVRIGIRRLEVEIFEMGSD